VGSRGDDVVTYHVNVVGAIILVIGVGIINNFVLVGVGCKNYPKNLQVCDFYNVFPTSTQFGNNK
jgi:hypothetical protein